MSESCVHCGASERSIMQPEYANWVSGCVIIKQEYAQRFDIYIGACLQSSYCMYVYTQVQYTWLYYRFPVIVVKNECTRYAVTSNQGQYYHHHSSIVAQNVYKVAHLQRTVHFDKTMHTCSSYPVQSYIQTVSYIIKYGST